MYFYKHKGKQILDLRGDLILTHNNALVKGRIKSAAPAGVTNAKYIQDIPAMNPFRKFRATLAAIRFIWGKSEALSIEDIERENGTVYKCSKPLNLEEKKQ